MGPIVLLSMALLGGFVIGVHALGAAARDYSSFRAYSNEFLSTDLPELNWLTMKWRDYFRLMRGKYKG